MAGSMTFTPNASFKSIVSKCGSYDSDEDSTIEAKFKSMAGSTNPAVDPTVTTAGSKTVTVTRHPNDDPNWNGPVKDA